MSVKYLVDEKTGKKTGVFLSINEYEDLLERAEDIEALNMLRKLRKKPLDIRSFDSFLKNSI